MPATLATRYFPVNSKSLIGPLIADCYALSVDSKTIRRNNLRQLFGQYGSQKAFAEAAGLDPGHVSQMNTGHRAVGDKIARHSEELITSFVEIDGYLYWLFSSK